MKQCYATEDLYDEDDLVYDINTNRYFHPSQLEEFNRLCAIEFGWNEEEIAGNLETLKSFINHKNNKYEPRK